MRGAPYLIAMKQKYWWVVIFPLPLFIALAASAALAYQKMPGPYYVVLRFASVILSLFALMLIVYAVLYRRRFHSGKAAGAWTIVLFAAQVAAMLLLTAAYYKNGDAAFTSSPATVALSLGKVQLRSYGPQDEYVYSWFSDGGSYTFRAPTADTSQSALEQNYLSEPMYDPSHLTAGPGSMLGSSFLSIAELYALADNKPAAGNAFAYVLVFIGLAYVMIALASMYASSEVAQTIFLIAVYGMANIAMNLALKYWNVFWASVILLAIGIVLFALFNIRYQDEKMRSDFSTDTKAKARGGARGEA